MKVKDQFWGSKKVLVTGHTGFKGGWLSIWLQKMGAVVFGYSLPPAEDINFFSATSIDKVIDSNFGNIQNKNNLQTVVSKFEPDIVFHLAAQALVRESYADPVETYSTNVIGTINLLESLRACKNVKVIINVTSDKCYENKEWDWGYRENDSLGGLDPYSSSKACAEIVAKAYWHSFLRSQNISLGSVRAGNVIGGGDWSADRLIPDILHGIASVQTIKVRNPTSIRPWQHVLEPLSGYLLLAEYLYKNTGVYGAWNFGPLNNDVCTVEEMVCKLLQASKSNVGWELDSGKNPHEARLLKLDISKAQQDLNWKPRWDLDYALTKIIDWQGAFLKNEDMYKFSVSQISDYINS
jgi:CDP-glucose 4,6-dehydratase